MGIVTEWGRGPAQKLGMSASGRAEPLRVSPQLPMA